MSVLSITHECQKKKENPGEVEYLVALQRWLLFSHQSCKNSSSLLDNPIFPLKKSTCLATKGVIELALSLLTSELIKA